MKNTYVLPLAALLLLDVSAVAQTNALLPPPPAIWREVTGVTNTALSANPVVTRPHVPAFRITRDGRVGIRVISNCGFALLMPEKLTNYVLLTRNTSPTSNSYVMSSTVYKYIDGVTDPSKNETNFYSVPTNSSGGIDHVTIYDPTPEFHVDGETVNPTNDAFGNDIYNLKVIADYAFDKNDPNHTNAMQIFVTPVTLVVTNPKTASASIISAKCGIPKGGIIFSNTGMAFNEPNVAGDGRLLVFRNGSSAQPWVDPDTRVQHPSGTSTAQKFDICYSYYTNGDSCDVMQWTNIIPIAHAPYDSRLTNLFGFAMQPFRDPAGNVIPGDVDIGGTYPWIDREARNLFFTTVSDTLRYATNNTNNASFSRYGQVRTSEETNLDVSSQEIADGTRGIVVAGLWTHGKIVMLDNLNNDMDYAMGSGGKLSTRMVHLFNSNAGVTNGSAPDWLRLGAGRVNADPAMPPGDNRNSTVIESPESTFNYRKFAVPTTIGDVVWPIHNAKNSDDLMFDDFVDPNGFIIANMAGAETFGIQNILTKTHQTNWCFNYYSGWDSTNHSWDLPVLLQNAACAPTNYWIVPTNGIVIGAASSTPAGRLEPAATGGIHGKGFWMTGSNGVQFNVVGNQPQNITNKNWYAGIFVDCRFANDGVTRVLLTFPDSTSIRLVGRTNVQYFVGSTLVNSINLPAYSVGNPFADMMPSNGWAHLAWQIRNGGTNVDFLLNGMLYSSFSYTSSLFQMTAGAMTVGKPTGSGTSGFNGWIDEFIVLAHTVDPESACNHAGGTLVGLPAGYTGYLTNFAAKFPASTHAAITFLLMNSGQTNSICPTYANYYSYTNDYGAHLGNIPSGAVSVRQAIHFPEGPLFYNAPRPDSSNNKFCLTCHTSDGDEGLGIDKLMLVATNNADVDQRRQPFQSRARVFGHIPTNYVDNSTGGLPTSATNITAASGGQYIDDWLLPQFTTNVVVTSFTLVDADHNVDLANLTNQCTVHLMNYPNTTNYAIRANLNSEQGSVIMTFDGQPPVTKYIIPYINAVGSLSGSTTHTNTAVPTQGTTTNQIVFYTN